MAPQSIDTNAEAISLWKKRFDKRHPSTNPVIAILDIEYNELVLSWKKLQETLTPSDLVQFQERAQGPEDVLSLVSSIEPVWTSSARQRVVRDHCTELRSTLHAHSILLSALPKNEAYMSLFYSVLQSTLKASAHYPRIMEGYIKSLVMINRSSCLAITADLSSCSKETIHSIAHFYTLFFFFLGEFMDWFVRQTKCRLLKSPNHNVHHTFRDLVGHLRHSAKVIIGGIADMMDVDEDDNDTEDIADTTCNRELCLFEQARLDQIGLQRRDRRHKAENAFIRHLVWEIAQDAVKRARLLRERDALLAHLLDTVGHQIRPVSQQNTGIACLTTTASRDIDMDRFTSSEGGQKHKYTRAELQLASSHLENFFDADDQTPELDPDVEVIAEENVMTSLQQWATDAYSQVLAVGGSPTTAFPSPVLLISTCYASLARKARLPVISHFCTRSTNGTDELTYEQQLIALAYSLIRQLIEYLPPVIISHSGCNLSAERFKPLNGTLTSWKEVLSLIDILLYYAPPLMVCVIHGLDAIQDASTDEHIRSLVRILLTHTRHQTATMEGGLETQSVLLKILFTVAGRPSSLVETLSESQLILRESNQTEELATTDSALSPDVGVVMMNA
ncbi:phytanoyl-CoA dioxygenase family protein [Aspergillus japonicus CBS 114.51]|uniref:Phytanoyl-CoA dioxygenase family protein n=1 Tax=Aspergillus japonicus CBS 114.51 TaxID=1448312 RepID=A0A8T8XE73_ASPJA|nr:phytanoyl-CoA dioxygenase family protein [Aspergillus japonicus CBS 114.51]RAH86586.1 phytanoyl-CoA dioxygenase family protein [Aspergillus japonicus CBS 114.51]